MYLPKIYEKFSSKFPEVFNDFQQLGKTCRESGPLEKNTRTSPIWVLPSERIPAER
jgi:hypothetical protein